MADKLVTIATFRFLPEAEAIRMYPRGQGIASYLGDAETVNMDWLLGNASGFIKLQVASSHAARAAALVEQMRSRQRQHSASRDEDEASDEAQTAC